MEEVDRAMTSIRDHGFINFFGEHPLNQPHADFIGMQRFGTSTVPTHVTGLLLLQQKWGQAIDSILSLRDGEHPDCTRARLAWLEDGDYRRALELMPRRSVTERAIWEYWKKGNRLEDKLGALASVSVIQSYQTNSFIDTPQHAYHVRPRVPKLYLEPHHFRAYQNVEHVAPRG